VFPPAGGGGQVKSLGAKGTRPPPPEFALNIAEIDHVSETDQDSDSEKSNTATASHKMDK